MHAQRTRRSFILGLVSGFILTAAVVTGGAFGALYYVTEQAKSSSTFAVVPETPDGEGRVELYFPLERFLAWRSTAQVQLGLQGDRVHIHLLSHIISQLPWRVAVDISGEPSVSRGYFTLHHVSGSVNRIPVPTGLLLGAIAMDGAKYGIHVNDARDSLFVAKNFGSYRLAGYDRLTKDLIISLPIQTVERAARGQTVI